MRQIKTILDKYRCENNSIVSVTNTVMNEIIDIANTDTNINMIHQLNDEFIYKGYYISDNTTSEDVIVTFCSYITDLINSCIKYSDLPIVDDNLFNDLLLYKTNKTIDIYPETPIKGKNISVYKMTFKKYDAGCGITFCK